MCSVPAWASPYLHLMHEAKRMGIKAAAALIGMVMIQVCSAQTWEFGQGTEDLNLQAIIADGDLVITGGATGTYRSLDGGETYVSANVGNTSIGPTRGLTRDGDFIYKCTSSGVFRSADEGASWMEVSSGLPQLLCHGMAHADGKLWVVTPTGVFTSTDQGAAWSAAGLDGYDVRCVALHDGVAYVGTQGDGLFRSADGGGVWEAINNGSTSDNFRAIEAHNGTLFAGGQIGTGVFRSTDGGDSWELLDNGIPVGSYRGFASNGDWIAAGAFGSGVYVSSDNGDTWTTINAGLEDPTIFDLDFSGTHLVAATNEAGAWRMSIDQLGAPSSSPSDAVVQSGLPWPNPCSRLLYLEGHHGATYMAFDVAGGQVASGNLDGHPVDVSEWPSGLIRIRWEGAKEVHTVLVQRD